MRGDDAGGSPDLAGKRPDGIGHRLDAGGSERRAEQETLGEIGLDLKGKDLQLLECLDADGAVRLDRAVWENDAGKSSLVAPHFGDGSHDHRQSR